MRKLSVLIFTFLSLSMAKAEVITQDAARQKAENFVTNRLKAGKRATTRGVQNIEIAESRNAFYVFNIGEVDGYVVVSGDDRMPDILGYSDNGNFDGRSIPDNLRGWLQGYERQYEYLKAHPDGKLTSRGSDSRKPIAPMLECHWRQGSPYNDLCPEGCPTGCTATAMAQIMYYHKWPKQTTKTIPAYTTKTNKYEIPSIGVTTIDWDNMQSTYNSSSSEASRKAVATLMKLCGAAVKMDYGPEESPGAVSAFPFFEYFDYETDIVRLSRNDFQKDNWNDIIYEELINQRPVLYDGNPEGDGDGHAFVVDGYDSNDYFHINFGWGGYCDAFFLLSVITFGDCDYSFRQCAVVRIEPTSTTKAKPYITLDNETLTLHYDTNRDKSDLKVYSTFLQHESLTDALSQAKHLIISPSFTNYTLYSLDSWLSGFSNLETIEGLGNLNTTYVTVMRNMFYGCSGLTSLDVSHLNTSHVTDMGWMFYDCSGLTSLDVSKFNTSNVTDMSYMFSGCSNLSSLDVSNFNTSNVTDMSYMFEDCSSLTSLDVSNFNTSNVINMDRMFYGCSGLTSLDVSNLNTSNITDLSYMFDGCSGLTSLDVSKFNTSNVTDMSYMFDGCSGLTSLNVYKLNTSNVTDMSGIFYGCSGLTSLDVSNFDTSNVTSMWGMFEGCSGLTSLDVSKLNTSNATEMGSMFSGCSGLTSLDVSNFDTANVTDMSAMFFGCSGLTSLDVSNFNTSNVTYMIYMFYGCSGLTSLDVSNFDTSNVTNMFRMFEGCSGLTLLDLSNFNTSNVTGMSYMFRDCSGLTSLDMSKFDTSNVTSMGSMFRGCSSLTSLGMSKFNTSNVTSMWGMFEGCSGLTSLDVSNFNTSNVTDMGSMFRGCSSLKTIFASDAWSTDKIENSENMFYRCSKLVGGKGTKFDRDNPTDHTYARFDGGESAPGYFTVPGLKGDCNGDGTVNEADVAEIENYIMGKPSDKFIKSAADMNYDGVINAADIVEVVKIIKANK